MKKFLSLVLALVMVLSLGVTAGAVDFTDEAAITKEEAVAVLSGVGIINGYEAADGTFSFSPNGNITRGAAAKIIAMIKLGTKVSALLTCETAPFKDVAKDSTFAPYIAYCANEGIVGGYADGTYKPGNPVSGYAFTKMLLNALGIKGNYEGANYGVNVALAADAAGLFEGMDADTVYSANCIREDACQLAFNALKYTAEGATSQYVVTKDSKVVYKGSDALTALVMAQAGGTLTIDTTYTGSLGDKHFGLKDSEATDNFGRTSKTWVDKNNEKTVYASIAPNAKLTYTTVTTYTKIATALGATNATAVKLTVVEDGVRGTQYTVYKNSTKDTLGIASLNIGGQGTLVQVYQTGKAADKTYDVVVINTYAKKLADGDFIKANADTETKAAIVLDTDLEYETTAFKANDVVLYTVGQKDGKAVVDNVVKAAYVTGKVTAVAGDKSYIRVDGVQYKAAANNEDSTDATKTAIENAEDGYKYNKDDATTYTYYLDNFNNIIMIDSVAPEKAKENYIYVIEAATAFKGDTAVGGSLFETSAANTAAAQVRVIDLATAAISVKNIALVKKTNGDIVYATTTGAASDNVIAETNDPTLGGAFTAAGVYKYVTLTDGSIVLDGKVDKTADVLLKKDTALLKAGKYANSATKLTTIETTSKDGKIVSATAKTVTGIANFDKNADSTTVAVDLLIADTKTGIASEIVIVKAKADVKETTKYAIYKGAGETDASGEKYAFYVNGAVVEYVKASGATIEVTAADEGKTVVTYELENGKVKTVKAATNKIAAIAGAKVVVVDASFMIVEKDSVQTVVYFNTNGCTAVDAGASFAVAAVAVNDVVDVYGTVAAADFIVIAK